MLIQWTEKARNDLDYIEAYIKEDNPVAALKTVLRIINTIESNLIRHPGMGRPGRHPLTRELMIAGTPYIVPYQVNGETIVIYRVIHGAMQWPDEF